MKRPYWRATSSHVGISSPDMSTTVGARRFPRGRRSGPHRQHPGQRSVGLRVLECVVNISEGRRPEGTGELPAPAGPCLLDVHSDPDHNRSVFTLAGAEVEEAARSLARAAVEAIDLRAHTGVHPRFGSVDVVPFVPLGDEGADLGTAVAARDRFAAWAGDALRLPC